MRQTVKSDQQTAVSSDVLVLTCDVEIVYVSSQCTPQSPLSEKQSVTLKFRLKQTNYTYSAKVQADQADIHGNMNVY